jgi:hypothetical protein
MQQDSVKRPPHVVVAQEVPGPWETPPLARQVSGSASVQVVPLQQASVGAVQPLIAHVVPAPCGVPPRPRQSEGRWSVQLPAPSQHASVALQSYVAHAVPGA